MESVLSKFGIVGECMHGFKASYTHPHTRVILPGCNSEYFELGRGTWQGCPLPPLLFALAIEPLARSITLNQDIKGYVKDDSQFKLSMYALTFCYLLLTL